MESENYYIISDGWCWLVKQKNTTNSFGDLIVFEILVDKYGEGKELKTLQTAKMIMNEFEQN